MTQLEFFTNEEMGQTVAKKASARVGAGSKRSYYDYEAYVAKFKDMPKTTDDTYTPDDVYDAVLQYVDTVYPLEGKYVMRPFYPGGDYKAEEYPENCVVIDNPPFSIFTQIVKWYTANGIPFFLFGPGLTIGSCTKYCTAVITGKGITFENGANVSCNFASNLYGDIMICTAPLLGKLIENCASQKQVVGLPSFDYPEELLNVSTMQTIANGGVEFSVRRSEAKLIRELDNDPRGKGGLFGYHWLIAKAKAKAKAKLRRSVPIALSLREERIVDTLPTFDTDF